VLIAGGVSAYAVRYVAVQIVWDSLPRVARPTPELVSDALLVTLGAWIVGA
jgi:hypothetical protein